MNDSDNESNDKEGDKSVNDSDDEGYETQSNASKDPSQLSDIDEDDPSVIKQPIVIDANYKALEEFFTNAINSEELLQEAAKQLNSEIENRRSIWQKEGMTDQSRDTQQRHLQNLLEGRIIAKSSLQKMIKEFENEKRFLIQKIMKVETNKEVVQYQQVIIEEEKENIKRLQRNSINFTPNAENHNKKEELIKRDINKNRLRILLESKKALDAIKDMESLKSWYQNHGLTTAALDGLQEMDKQDTTVTPERRTVAQIDLLRERLAKDRDFLYEQCYGAQKDQPYDQQAVKNHLEGKQQDRGVFAGFISLFSGWGSSEKTTPPPKKTVSDDQNKTIHL